MLNETKP